MSRATSFRLPAVTLSEGAGVRYLHLDSVWIQGAMRIRKPLDLELEYVRRMLAALLLRPARSATQGRAVHLGLGAAALTKYTHSVLRMPTTTVELNPAVIEACRAWFHLPADTARLRVLQMDAGAWVEDAANLDSVDALFVDLYDREAAAPVLDSAAFYGRCAGVLKDGGVMAVNLFGEAASFERSLARMARAFGAGQVGHLQACKEGNTIALACKSAHWPQRDALEARAQSLQDRLGLPAGRWVRLLHAPRG